MSTLTTAGVADFIFANVTFGESITRTPNMLARRTRAGTLRTVVHHALTTTMTATIDNIKHFKLPILHDILAKAKEGQNVTLTCDNLHVITGRLGFPVQLIENHNSRRTVSQLASINDGQQVERRYTLTIEITGVYNAT